MRLRLRHVILFAAFLAVWPAQVARADAANNIFRFSLGWVEPYADTTVTIQGQDVNLESSGAATGLFDYEGRVLPWLGLDVQASYGMSQVTATPSAGGTSTSQDITNISGTFGVNFHFFGRSRVDLYLGPYASYSSFYSTFEDAFGYGAVLGLDFALTKSGLALTSSVRYTITDTDLTADPSISVSYDSLLFELGLGWRF